MKNNIMKNTIIAITVSITMLISLNGCGRKSQDETVDKTTDVTNVIEIASVTPLSGNNAAFGEVLKNGAQMALQERKEEFKKLGFELNLKPLDDQGEAKVGVSIAQKLLTEKNVLAVMGHFNSGVAIPSSVFYNKDNLLMMSPANTAVILTERGLKCVNRIVARDDLQGPVAAKFTMEDLAAKKVFVIHDGTDYGKGIADEYKKTIIELSGQMVGFEGIAVKDTDFSGVLAKVATVNPDVLFFAGVCPEGPLLLKQMREKNMKVKFLGPDGIDSSDTLKIAKDNVVNTYYTSTAGVSTNTEKGKEWAKKYQTMFDKAPENYSAYGYDAMNMILNAIVQAINDNDGKKPSRLQVTDAARQLKIYEGIATKVELDDKGDNKEAAVFIYKYNKAAYPADVVRSISAKEYKK